MQQAQKCDDLSSSSTAMISFELSNGRLYSPLVPIDLGDDQYVEFQLDDFPGIPSTAKEEQKVSPYYNLLLWGFFMRGDTGRFNTNEL